MVHLNRLEHGEPPKRISHLIIELARLLAEHGDMEVVVRTSMPGFSYGRAMSVQGTYLSSVAQLAGFTPHVEYALYGTCNENGDELTVGGMRLDGREPVAVIKL